MADFDLDLVRHALITARTKGFVTVDLKFGSGKFHAHLEPKKKTKRVPTLTSTVQEVPAPPDFKVIASNHVGYFRSANPPFLAEDEIKQGDMVGYIIVLGLPNELESKVSGVIEEVFVEEDAAVEFGQPLFRVKPL